MSSIINDEQQEKGQGGFGNDVKKDTSASEDSSWTSFAFSNGITTQEFLNLQAIHGKNELPDKSKSYLFLYLELLIEPMPLMIWAASVIELFLQNYIDMSILLAILLGNASISFIETINALEAIAKLKKSFTQEEACVLRDGVWKIIASVDLVPGDCIQLNLGEIIPADCRLNKGNIDCDESSLTGESLPSHKFTGDKCYMGSAVQRGESVATIEYIGTKTMVSTTAQLAMGDERKSNLQDRLVDIMIVLVCLTVTICCIVLYHLLITQQEELVESMSFVVILLVASIPLAIEIVTTTTLALGAKELTHSGAIVKRLGAIEELAGIAILCCDKTGTLTKNKMVLYRGDSGDGDGDDDNDKYDISKRKSKDKGKGKTSNSASANHDKKGDTSSSSFPIYMADITEYDIMRYAAMACKWNEETNKPDMIRKLDALDTLILHNDLHHYDEQQAEEDSLHKEYLYNIHKMFVGGDEHEKQIEYIPFDAEVKRTESTMIDHNNVLDSKTGTKRVFKVSKGASAVILKLVRDTCPFDELPALEKLIKKIELDVTSFAKRGIRTLAIAIMEATYTDTEKGIGKWEIVGLLPFLDPPRYDSKQTIEEAKKYGIQVKMITGDQLLIAKETASALNMGSRIFNSNNLPVLTETLVWNKGKQIVKRVKPAYLCRDYGDICLAADGFAHVMPEHKYLIVECLRELGYKVGMTGDGVNDAPALKVSDVGIAVQGATDAASAAADIQLTRPGLGAIINAIITSRRIFARITNFLTYRIAATLQLLFFFFLAVFLFNPSKYQNQSITSDTVTGPVENTTIDDLGAWPTYFHLPVLMLMLITVLNDGALIAIGYDHVIPSQTPAVWNLRVLFTIGSVLASVACVSSLLLLHTLLNCNNPTSIFQIIGMDGLNYGQITASIYLKVSVSDFLTLFSARTGENWFWHNTPAKHVEIAAAVALALSTIIACIWPTSTPDNVQTQGLAYSSPKCLAFFVWCYCIFWWFIQDFCKVMAFRYLKTYNIFDINNTGELTYPESTVHYMQDADEAKIRLLSEHKKPYSALFNKANGSGNSSGSRDGIASYGTVDLSMTGQQQWYDDDDDDDDEEDVR